MSITPADKAFSQLCASVRGWDPLTPDLSAGFEGPSAGM